MSDKHTVWYSIDKSDWRYSCLTKWEVVAYLSDIPGCEETDVSRHHDWIAEDCAEDYHHNHDGWESRLWPKLFTLYATEDGPALSKFEVERDVEPVFSASKVKP